MALQAITTKYHGPTDVRGSRISARSASGESVFIDYDDALDTGANHRAAAIELCQRLFWYGTMVQGATKEGYCFTFINPEDTFKVEA